MLNLRAKNKSLMMLISIYFLLISTFGCSVKNDKDYDAEFIKDTNYTLIQLIKDSKIDNLKIPYEKYEKNIKNYPVGVFDSGIGGLTVFKVILEIDHFNNKTGEEIPDNVPDFANERFIYLADQANMPYGTYPSLEKVDFLRELIMKDALFLLGNRYWPSEFAKSPSFDKPPVKAIVIACNTATSYGLEMLRYAFRKWNLPVYIVGVVETGARGAVESLKVKGENNTIAVMATVGTTLSNGYPKAIEKIAKQENIENITVVQHGSLGIAGAVEGNEEFVVGKNKKRTVEYKGPSLNNTDAPIDLGLLDAYNFDIEGFLGDKDNPATWQLNSVENYIRYDVVTLLENYRKTDPSKPISIVILGCTHYPFYIESFKATFKMLKEFVDANGEKRYSQFIDDNLIFIDPSELTAIELYKHLVIEKLLLEKYEKPSIFVNEFYISVPNKNNPNVQSTPTGAFTYEYKYSRIAGNYNNEDVIRVPMSNYNLKDVIQKNIMNNMPVVWKSLVEFNWKSPRTKNLPQEARLKKD
jgi:glutamate racemase